jgi:hypothetical protein
MHFVHILSLEHSDLLMMSREINIDTRTKKAQKSAHADAWSLGVSCEGTEYFLGVFSSSHRVLEIMLHQSHISICSVILMRKSRLTTSGVDWL